MKSRSVNLTEGPIARSLIVFALPLMFSNIFQQLYNTVDSVVVGRFAGSVALAATGASTPLINLLVNFFLGIATGAGVVYGAAYGANDRARMVRLANTALILGAGAGLLLTLIGSFFARPMLEVMHTPADMLDQSVAYLRIYFLGMIPNLLYNVGAGLIRAYGDSKRPLYYLIFSGCLNALLDVIFVAVLKMGVSGAALATILCQTLSCVLVLRYLRCLLPEDCRVRPAAIRWDRAAGTSILRLALPMGLQSAMFSISNFLVQVGINGFGTTAIAGCSAYIKIDGFNYMPLQAIGLANTTFSSQNFGAGRPDRVRKAAGISVLLGLAIGIFCCGICMLFSRPLLHIFTDEEDVVEAGLVMLWHLAPFAWIFSSSDMLGGTMRGAGAARPVTIITASCICVLRIIWLYTAAPLIGTIEGVFWCYPVSWILCVSVMALYFFKGNWMKYSKNLGTEVQALHES